MTSVSEAGADAIANEHRKPLVSTLIILTVLAAGVRMVALLWLHPLNWDEVEFFRATDWVSQGLVPFRDFWEHHTPLQWFLFAPIAALIDSPGTNAIIGMRLAQVPLWIAAFWLVSLWMRREGASQFAHWAAIVVALCTGQLLMNSAVEYRVDILACVFYLAALVLFQRMNGSRAFALAIGGALCLAGFSNLRLGPLLVVTILLMRFVDLRAKKWTNNRTANWIFVGGAATFLLGLTYFVATDSLQQLYRHVWYDNYLGDQVGASFSAALIHRLLVPFGVRIVGAPKFFDPAGVDFAGITVLLVGAVAIYRALRRWRQPDSSFLLALLQVVNLVFMSRLNFVYNYHFTTVTLMMIPLLAVEIDRILLWRPAARRYVAVALVLISLINAGVVLFRGKELDRAYQDLIMRTVDSRTRAGEKVWDGVGWALRRQPAYRFWFLPDQPRQLVRRKLVPGYELRDLVRDPPAAIILDYNLLIWLAMVQPELGPYVVRHYVPLWRNLWVPGMNARLTPQSPEVAFVVPGDGAYRIHASARLARHHWFRDPIYVGGYTGAEASRSEYELRNESERGTLRWSVNDVEIQPEDRIEVRRGDVVRVRHSGSQPLGLILLPTDDRRLFRQPPVGVTLEAASPRETHWPQFGVRLPE